MVIKPEKEHLETTKVMAIMEVAVTKDVLVMLAEDGHPLVAAEVDDIAHLLVHLLDDVIAGAEALHDAEDVIAGVGVLHDAEAHQDVVVAVAAVTI